jgi:pyrroline-5-carboxylate reductase
MRGIFVGCCALATTVTVSIAAATKIDDQPTFLNSHLVRLRALLNTDKAAEKGVICGIVKTRLFEEEKVNSDVVLN